MCVSPCRGIVTCPRSLNPRTITEVAGSEFGRLLPHSSITKANKLCSSRLNIGPCQHNATVQCGRVVSADSKVVVVSVGDTVGGTRSIHVALSLHRDGVPLALPGKSQLLLDTLVDECREKSISQVSNCAATASVPMICSRKDTAFEIVASAGVVAWLSSLYCTDACQAASSFSEATVW